METQHWLDVARERGYIKQSERDAPVARCEEVGRIIGGMVAKANLFSQPEKMHIKEDVAPYDTDSPSNGGPLNTEN